MPARLPCARPLSRTQVRFLDLELRVLQQASIPLYVPVWVSTWCGRWLVQAACASVRRPGAALKGRNGRVRCGVPARMFAGVQAGAEPEPAGAAAGGGPVGAAGAGRQALHARQRRRARQGVGQPGAVRGTARCGVLVRRFGVLHLQSWCGCHVIANVSNVLPGDTPLITIWPAEQVYNPVAAAAAAAVLGPVVLVMSGVAAVMSGPALLLFGVVLPAIGGAAAAR